MGMFDRVDIKFDIPEFPGTAEDKNDFQTKEFDCNLDKYEIDENGRLFKYDWAWVNEEVKDLDYKIPVDFTGDIFVIGDYGEKLNNGWGKSIEYRIWFRGGIISRIQQLCWNNADHLPPSWYFNGALAEDFKDNLPPEPLTPEEQAKLDEIYAKLETPEGRKAIAELFCAPLRVPVNYAAIGRKLLKVEDLPNYLLK